jgi:dienelactone hydrolase
MQGRTDARPVKIPDRGVRLDGDLQVPEGARGLVVFAHGSGSSRFSSRNRLVAAALNDAGFATLLLDLLTPAEESVDLYTGEFRFDIPRLAARVVAAIDWASADEGLRTLPLGCFGASTGAAAALIAAAERPMVAAVVSRGGRPDLAQRALAHVRAPTLLIVGGADEPVIEMNRAAERQMTARVTLEIVPNATHLFEEPGALEEVSRLAIDWFDRYLAGPSAASADVAAVAEVRRVHPVAPGDWENVLDGFSREHRAWLAHVEGEESARAGQEDRPLTAVRTERRGSQIVAIRIDFGSGEDGASIRIEQPVAVAVEAAGDGTPSGLDIEDAAGRHTTLRFRVARPAAMLDGVAPGEL